MMKWSVILAVAFAAGCTATQTASPRVPTKADIRALLAPSDAAFEIKGVRPVADRTFIVFFGDPELAPEKFDDAQMIRPPIKVVWTNEHWELRTIFDNRNPGNRKRSANQTMEGTK